MAVTTTLTLEGTPGTSISLANAGVTPQAISGGNTAVFATEAKAGGATGVRFERVNGGNAAGAFARLALPASTPTLEFSGVWTASAQPGSDVGIWSSRNSSGRVVQINRRSTGGYELIDQANVYAPTPLITAANAIAGHQYRFVLALAQGTAANNGTVQAAVYDLTAGTTVSSWTWSTATLTTSPFTGSDFGTINNVNAVAMWDDMQYGNGTSMLPPLASNVAPTASLSLSANNVEPGTTVTVTATATDTDGTIASVAFSSPTLTLQGSGNATRTFTAPASLVDTQHTINVTATDNAGATGAASIIATVLAATVRVAGPGGMLPAYLNTK